MPPVTPRAIRDISLEPWTLRLLASWLGPSTFSTLPRRFPACATFTGFCSLGLRAAPSPSGADERGRRRESRTRTIRQSASINHVGRPFRLRYVETVTMHVTRLARAHAREPRAFRQHDGSEPLDGRLELVVDDDVVVLGRRRRPPARATSRRRCRGLGVLAAAAQPPLEHVERRRQHENADASRPRRRVAPAARPARRSRAPGRARRRDARSVSARRCRRVAEDVGPLEELVLARSSPRTGRG